MVSEVIGSTACVACLLTLSHWILAAEPSGKHEDLPLEDFSGGDS